MRCLITGAAGFIGSTLAARLLADGHDVTGVDVFTDYYDRRMKEANIARVSEDARFRLVRADLASDDLSGLLEGVDAVFHLAGQPGVRGSWGKTFDPYARNNILATQRLLEAAKGMPLRKLVYASSSSIYGDAESFPTAETALPKPVSPYGVTKLAAEHLCYLYWKNHAVPAVAVRYFTVYGPGQRPDMAFHKFIRAGLEGRAIGVYGDGEQTRDFTFVEDAVAGTVAAALDGAPGEVYNLGGGSRVTLNQVLATLQGLLEQPLQIDRQSNQKGDVRHTSADTRKAARALGYCPKTDLATGLEREVRWLRRFVA